MKHKWIIGAMAIVAVAIGYCLGRKKKGRVSANSVDSKSNSDTVSMGNDGFVAENKIDNIQVKKENLISTVQERHEQAATVMKESLEKIVKNTNDDIILNSKSDLDEIDTALNKMLDD